MRVCKRGHELKPENTYVSPNGKRRCKTCQQAYKREHRQRNLEKRKAYDREYYQRNREKIKAYKREYYVQHRAERLAYAKRHHREIKERRSERP